MSKRRYKLYRGMGMCITMTYRICMDTRAVSYHDGSSWEESGLSPGMVAAEYALVATNVAFKQAN